MRKRRGAGGGGDILQTTKTSTPAEDGRRRQDRTAESLVGRQTRTTFAACSPFSPVRISNSTSCPSDRVLNPSIAIAEKCTNTSSPLSCSMKPYPLASLNHLTFPLAI